jgi:glycosyltransferase involved in cell wall biosynthesis
MPHGPPYQYAPGELPDVRWKRPDGEVVGFWPREWLDILGAEVVKATDRYDWEVWQPDYRADMIYSKTLETGVTHRLFPAQDKPFRIGVSLHDSLFSEPMIAHLWALRGERILLMLYGTYGFRVPLYHAVLKTLGPARRFPIFLRSGGMFMAPYNELWGLHRPLTYLSLLVEHVQLKRVFRYADVISEQSESGLREVRKLFNGRIEKLTMGCDFDFWVPVPSPEVKAAVQSGFNISHDKTVFFASGNFVPRKQFNKLIEIFRALQERDDFFLIIAGHGDEPCTKMLASLVEPLATQKKAVLHPFVTGKELRNIYWASDLYVSVATDEGGPASVMKAMACGLPVLSTPVGETADTMKKHSAGRFVPVKGLQEWSKTVLEILHNGLPSALQRTIAREAYDWPNVARRFVNLYDSLFEQYFGQRAHLEGIDQKRGVQDRTQCAHYEGE